MKDRLRQLRLALGLTQRSFADQIGMRQNTVATWEMGRSRPSDRAVRYLCQTFRASETWLRTGEGAMFLPANDREQVAEFVGRALSGEDPFPRRLLLNLSRLTPKEWKMLERLFTETPV